MTISPTVLFTKKEPSTFVWQALFYVIKTSASESNVPSKNFLSANYFLIETDITRSSLAPGFPRPSVLLVMNHNSFLGETATSRIRP